MLTPEEKQIHIEAMHHACRQVRYAIAVLDADVPADETTVARLAEAESAIRKVREALSA